MAGPFGAEAICAEFLFNNIGIKNSEKHLKMPRKLLIMKINLLKNNDFLRSDPQ